MDRRRLVTVGLAAAALLIAASPASAKPRTIKVNKTSDHAVNGCSKADCTLREAVRAADAHAGRDTVVLRSGKTYKLTQAGADEDQAMTGDLDLKGAVTLRTSGKKKATVDAAGLDRAFESGASVATFRNLTITGGSASGILAAGKVSVFDGRLAENSPNDISSTGKGKVLVRDSDLSNKDVVGALVEADGDGDIEVSGSKLHDTDAYGLRSLGAGDIKLSSSTVDDIAGNGIDEDDTGGIKVTRSSFARMNTAATNFGGDGITISRSKVRGTRLPAIWDFGSGSLSASRTSIRHSGGQALFELGDGDTVASRVSISDVGGDGIDEYGSGDLRATRVDIADTLNAGLREVNDGSVVANRVSIKNAGDDGIQEFNTGGLTFKRSHVSGAIGAGVSEPDGGALKVTRSTVTKATAGGVSDFGPGKGSITRSRIFGNDAGGGTGGGVRINNGASVKIDRSTVSGNKADKGAGIASDSSTLKVTNSTISGNRSTGDGGGAFFSAGSAQILDSTIAGNKAGGSGGGIDVTFAGNVQMNGATVTDNTASFGMADNGLGGGTYGGPVSARNSVIAANHQVGAADSVDCSALDSGGHNLIGNQSGCTGIAANDLVRSKPRLGKLRDNGGPTKTVALLKRSPAINKAGSDAPKRDQRGRKAKGRRDIGAFERGGR